MKSILLKVGVLTLSLILATGLFVSCDQGKDEDPAQTTVDYMHDFKTNGVVSVPSGNTHTFLSASVTDTVIVTSSRLKDGSPVFTAAQKLKNYISTFSGITLESKGDYLASDVDPSGITEILVGETTREESLYVAESLRVNDYAIQVVNNKLVVLGGCEAKTAEAVNKLIELYFSDDRADLVLECGYRYQFRYDYQLDVLTLDGTPISEYTIVYGKDCEGAATYLQTALVEAVGYRLPIAASADKATEHEILIGDTGRGGSVKADAGSYKVGMEKGNLVFAGDSSTVVLGVRDFVKQYVSGANGTSKVEANLSLSGKPSFESDLKLLSLNVTQSGYAENAVVNRYPRLYQMVTAEAPDVLCLQEVSCTTWMSCLKEGIGDTPALLDTYDFVGTGRNGEKPDRYDAFLEGAYNAILFNKAKYKLEDSGTFWLSDTPDTASVGWDGRTFAICTWAKLTEISSGRQFVVMNTQLDSYGRNAPAYGAKLICDKAAEFGLPVVLAGDFASNSNAKAYKNVVGSSFADTLTVAEKVEDKGLTFHQYGKTKQGLATSHVFVSRGLCAVKSYDLLTEQVGDGYVSAHWAIVTEIKY